MTGAIELAGGKQAVVTLTETVGASVLHSQTQNGRISELEKAEIARLATEKERQKWEDRREVGTRWMFGFGLAAAGVLSGIVFQIMEGL